MTKTEAKKIAQERILFSTGSALAIVNEHSPDLSENEKELIGKEMLKQVKRICHLFGIPRECAEDFIGY